MSSESKQSDTAGSMNLATPAQNERDSALSKAGLGATASQLREDIQQQQQQQQGIVLESALSKAGLGATASQLREDIQQQQQQQQQVTVLPPRDVPYPSPVAVREPVSFLPVTPAPTDEQDTFLSIKIEDIQVSAYHLGCGAYGSVMEVKYRGRKCAAKFFDRKENLDEKFHKEVDILSQLQHDNIVRYIGITYNPKPVLIMELLRTSLHNYLEEKPKLQVATMLCLLHDITKGLVYLHLHDVIHRDLTAKNVLLDDNNVAKIADFGNSRVIEFESYTGVTTMTADPGNRFYCAPETEGPHARYNQKVDCFAFGHLSIFAVIEEFPRNLGPGRTALERRRPYVKRVKSKLGDHHKLVGIIERCLGEYPHERPSASSLQSELSELCTKEDTRSTQSSDSATDSEERRRELEAIL